MFGFGLLHGLGFASVLTDFGMPGDAFATALISFNIGVELGQLAVISLAYLAIGYLVRQPVMVPASCAGSAVDGNHLDRPLLDLRPDCDRSDMRSACAHAAC